MIAAGGRRFALLGAVSLATAFVACIDVDGLRRGSSDAGSTTSSGGGSSSGGSSGGGSSGGGSSSGASSGCPACAFGQGEICCVPASGAPVCVGDGGVCADGTATLTCVSSAVCPDGGSSGLPTSNICCVAVNATATIGCRNAALPDRCKDDVEVCDPRAPACRGGGACTGPAPAGAPFLRTCK